MASLTLYHGSERIIEHPALAQALPRNDYGPGFYTTRELSMANEWACKRNHDGFANRYSLDDSGLAVLDLLDGSHSVLEWIALLLANRTFLLSAPVARDTRMLLMDRYLPDLSGIDLVVGYRADDSYFSYAQSFVENAITVEQLSRALVLGELGEQTVLVSERAFAALSFVDAAPVACAEWYPRFAERDASARRAWADDVRGSSAGGTYAIDLVRGEGYDAAPIRRPVSG